MMKKFTIRRVCLAGAGFVLSALSLLSLCFTVVKMDLQNAMGVFGDYFTATPGAAEHGFDLLDGKSNILVFFESFLREFAESANITMIFSSDFSALEIYAQVFNVFILIFSVLMCAGSVLWLFFCKSDRVIKTIAVSAVWVAVAYLIEGLLYTVYLNSTWEDILTAADETSLVFFKSMFTTAAYVPLILVAVFETAFWILHYKLSMREENAATEEHAQPVADVSVLPAERGAFTPSDLQYLRELKKLCDEGVLTQQEFDKAKAKYFER